MQSTISWLSSRACQQSIAVAELGKATPPRSLAAFGNFSWLDPHRRNKSKSPRTAGQPAQRGGEIGRPKGVHLQSCSRPCLPSLPPVPASRLLLPVNPDLP